MATNRPPHDPQFLTIVQAIVEHHAFLEQAKREECRAELLRLIACMESGTPFELSVIVPKP